MASVNPDDRDRGLRLVGAVTGAVAAVSLVAIGATTALAASDTRHSEQLRAASAEVTLQVGTPAAASSSPSAKPAPAHKAAKPKAAAPKATEKAKPKATLKPKPVVKPKPAVATTVQPPSVASTGS